MSAPNKKDLGSVLVIGGCGFLGHHIVKTLLEGPYNAQVSVLDLHTTRNNYPGVTYHAGDITSASDVKSVFETVKPKVIIHTASPTFVDTTNPAVFEKVNVHGTRNLLKCAKECPSTKAFVYTSSASVVHDSVSDLFNADESYPVLYAPIQREYYSETKGIAEVLVLAANDPKGVRTISIRPASIFGEGDVQLVPNLLRVADDGMTTVQLGDNTNLFDFTYVSNIADAHILGAVALLSSFTAGPDVPKVDGEAFFITNDAPIPFWDMARGVWAAAGSPTPIEKVWAIPRSVALALATVMEWVFWIVFFGTRKPTLTRQKAKYACMNRTFNIRKAKERLGYEPRVGMEEGIRRSVQFLRKDLPDTQKKKV